MAFRFRSYGGVAGEPAMLEIPKGTATAWAIGDALAWDRTTNVLIRATLSSTTLSIAAVAASTQVATDTVGNVYLVDNNQLWEADTTADTATTQIGERYPLTDTATVNNDGTDGATITDIIEFIAPIGAAGDRRALVRFVRVGQVTVNV